jgi:hypothetical protein
MAIDVMNKCYDANVDKAQCLLIKEMNKFDDLTVLQVAVTSNNLRLVAHPCTQSLLTDLWFHKISQDTRHFHVSISSTISLRFYLFIYFLFCLLLKAKNGSLNRVSVYGTISIQIQGRQACEKHVFNIKT